MTTLDTREQTRKRLIGTLFAGNAIASTAYIGIATVGALIAEQITGSTALSGLAPTVGTLGVAAAATYLSWMSSKTGRRPAFTAGFMLAVLGAILSIVSISTDNFLLLLAGMLGVGAGRSVTQLARYAAGDMRPQEGRAKAIGIIVWASTVGAVIGPPLIGPTSSLAATAGLDELIGPLVVAVIGFALVAILMAIGLRPDPMKLVVDDGPHESGARVSKISSLLASRSTQLSVIAVITSQTVMVLVMVMTPLHIRANDGSLATVGWVMMAHAIGMFAIAPVTGLLVSRVGARVMIGTAVGVFVASCALAFTASTASTPILVVSMFGVGVAWNFGFVAGSTLLQDGVAVQDRLKLQGFTDSSAWISGAVAAGLSGLVLANTSYATLAFLGAVLALIPLIPMYRLRTAPA
ncbi:MAG: MFS transporter [Acidimicrobiia bacterium]